MSNIKSKLIITLSLLAATYIYTQIYFRPVSYFFQTAEFTNKIDNFPKTIGNWRLKRNIIMPEDQYKALDPKALIFREYVNGSGEKVVLTIVYHENDRWGAHNVEVCYTSQGWKINPVNSLNSQTVVLDGPDITINKLEVEKLQHSRTVIYWWFAQGKKQMADRKQQFYKNIISSIFYSYNAGGLIRISSGIRDRKKALAVLADFTQQFVPIIDPYLP